MAAMNTKWNAADYAANSAVQQTWARELMAKLKLRGDEHVLDVGCGDGKVTAEIARALPRGSVTGADASPQMIEFAKKTFPAEAFPNLRFRVLDARKIKVGRQFDFVFSNAALHWVDDHQAILRGAASVLKPGGRLVVSCGGKGNAHDVFLALRPEMRLKRWREFFRRMPMPYFFYAPGDYEKWLPRFGFQINRLELAPKDAIYAGAEGFATWLRTTWIPYVQRVPEKVEQASSLSLSGKMPDPQKNLREEFIAAVTARYLAKHPPDKSGQVHVRMVRLEMDAVKI
ncbi:MAG TPA: methyltransferase domain-containing protein [Verrucomicrobiae bacterium]|nr:methyltransferase domain-containing protein [Verrucomicrobiae bacterium]